MDRVMIRKSSVINVCKNYDMIVSYLYDENDTMTKMLIDYYRDMMETINLDSIDEVGDLCKYDNALAAYLFNHKFYKMVQTYYHEQKDWGNSIIENINHLYSIHQELKLPICHSKWL